jgi:hypothetical protein
MKTLRNMCLVVLAGLGALTMSGCMVSAGFGGPVAVTPGPVGVDWWYDSGNYYYLDGGSGLYYYYGPSSEVIWMGRGWYPHSEWRGRGYPEHFPVYRGGRPVRGGWGHRR